MNTGFRGRKRLERSCDFHIWKVLGGGGALRGLKHLTYDGVMYFYFWYPLAMGYGLQIPAHQLGGPKWVWDFRSYGLSGAWVKRVSTVHASKIYPRGPVATLNASAAPLIELDR